MLHSLLLLSASLVLTSQELSASEPEKAQSPAETQSGGEIIVEAPTTPIERRRELRKFATSVIRRPRREWALASFFLPICPKVFGVPSDISEAIEERMLLNAKELGVPVASSKDCKHNISVMFMPPEAGTPEEWIDYESPLLDHMIDIEKRAVLDEKGPVRALNRTSQRGQNGQPFRRGAVLQNFRWHASRLELVTTSEIDGAIVMIELSSAIGKSATQLADYATMRSLANTQSLDEHTPVAAPTILTLFQDEDPPEELTLFDIALVSKLYDVKKNSLPKRAFSNIAGHALSMEQKAESVAESE